MGAWDNLDDYLEERRYGRDWHDDVEDIIEESNDDTDDIIEELCDECCVCGALFWQDNMLDEDGKCSKCKEK